MTALPESHRAKSDEAEWEGHERVWSSVQQFPPRKDRSSWWLVLIGALLVSAALIGLRT